MDAHLCTCTSVIQSSSQQLEHRSLIFGILGHFYSLQAVCKLLLEHVHSCLSQSCGSGMEKPTEMQRSGLD
jgi:hypothetical protein